MRRPMVLLFRLGALDTVVLLIALHWTAAPVALDTIVLLIALELTAALVASGTNAQQGAAGVIAVQTVCTLV
jgi:hypothetical protein